MAPKAEPTGGEDAATTSLGVETAAVEMEVKINISDDEPEVEMVTGIPDNPGASSSGEPSTVGAGVVTTSAVPTAVQMSPATTAVDNRGSRVPALPPSRVSHMNVIGDNTTTICACDLQFYSSELVLVNLFCSVNGVYGPRSTAVNAVNFTVRRDRNGNFHRVMFHPLHQQRACVLCRRSS